MARLGVEELSLKEGQILDPDDRVLVHVGQGALIGRVERLEQGVINSTTFKLGLNRVRESKEGKRSERGTESSRKMT